MFWKCHSSRDWGNSGPWPSNHSLWWCVGKEQAQTFNHQTNMWKGWFTWNYRGRKKQKRPFLPLEWDERKWTNKAVCSVCHWHLTLQLSHLITLDVINVINLGEYCVSKQTQQNSNVQLWQFHTVLRRLYLQIQLRSEANNATIC